MQIEKEVEDKRGKIIFLSFEGKQINVLELKKGFSRGGHYHKSSTKHFIISGKIEYRGKNVITGKERKQVFSSNDIIETPENEAHLLTALDNSIFLETFENDYEATLFPEYRKIVDLQL